MPAAVEAKSAEGEENGTRSLVAWPVFRPGRAGRPYRVRVLEREDGSAERTRRRLLSGNPLSPANFGPVEAAKTPRLRALLGVSASGTAGGSRPYFAARRDETKHTNERKGVALTKVRSQEGRAMFLLFRPWNQSQVWRHAGLPPYNATLKSVSHVVALGSVGPRGVLPLPGLELGLSWTVVCLHTAIEDDFMHQRSCMLAATAPPWASDRRPAQSRHLYTAIQRIDLHHPPGILLCISTSYRLGCKAHCTIPA